MKLNNRDIVPCVPKGWRDQQTKAFISWPCNASFDSFYAKVKGFTEANHLHVPTEAEVEEAICRQLPKTWCDGTNALAHQKPPPLKTPRGGGCRSCSGRRR